MEIQTTVTVAAEDIDSLGHVNNSKFLEYMEKGRLSWYQRLGFSLERMLELNLGTAVVNINVNFRRECVLGDCLKVVTRSLHRGCKSYVLAHEIHRQKGEIVVDAIVTSVVMDLQTRKTVPIPVQLASCFPRPPT